MNLNLIWALACACSLLAGTWWGTGIGEDKEFAKRAREDAIVQKAGDAAQTAAATEIAKIKTRSTVIRQETEREIRENTRYVDCRLTDGVFRNINEALTGQRPGDSSVPGTTTATR